MENHESRKKENISLDKPILFNTKNAMVTDPQTEANLFNFLYLSQPGTEHHTWPYKLHLDRELLGRQGQFVEIKTVI